MIELTLFFTPGDLVTLGLVLLMIVMTVVFLVLIRRRHSRQTPGESL